MPHHFTKGTVEASIWCNPCGKLTYWRVADGRRQYCLTCYEKKQHQAPPAAPAAPPTPETLSLFGPEASR